LAAIGFKEVEGPEGVPRGIHSLWFFTLGPGVAVSWETDFLAGIGAPATQTNIQACDLWAQSEGTLWANNPFACSGRYQGATRCIAQCGTTSEVWAYDTIDHGVAATVSFIHGSYYGKVIAAFQTDAGLLAIWQAINASPWCAGCQDGKYPIDLYNACHGGPTPPPPAPTPSEDDMGSQIAAWTDANGLPWYAVRGPGNRLDIYWEDDHAQWHGPYGVPNSSGTVFSVPTVTVNDQHLPTIVVQGPSNSLYVYWQADDAQWYGPAGIGGAGAIVDS
jgi:hypothetical protein